MLIPQSTFIKHEPCPKCLSKDNLGRWSDGHAYCFGCGYREDSSGSLQMTEVIKKDSNEVLSFSKELREDAYKWIKKYGITDTEISTHGIVWIPNRESLAFGFEQESGRYCTLRYFGRNSSHPKYLHSKHKDFVVVDSIGETRMARQVFLKHCLVFVEDYVSAIKVSRIVPASPIFGSTVGLERFKRASKLFKTFGIWLDSNMAVKAATEAIRASSVGFDVRGSIVGPKPDPKDHTDKEIEELVNGLFHV